MTGDKIGTAINIGLAAGLLDSKEVMTQNVIKEAANNTKLVEELMECQARIRYERMCESMGTPKVL